jgi:hypothetical protein
MALVKFSNPIVSIRGRIGGVYYKGGRGGYHAQSMPQMSMGGRAASVALQVLRWTGLATAWGLLAAAVAAMGGEVVTVVDWALFGNRFLYIQHLKSPKKLTNWQWFAHFNIPRIDQFLPPYTEPPFSPHDLPLFTVISDQFPGHTLNMYESWYMSGGRKSYYNPFRNGILFYENGYWFLTRSAEKPFQYDYFYRQTTSTDPRGVYTCSNPNLPDAEVFE